MRLLGSKTNTCVTAMNILLHVDYIILHSNQKCMVEQSYFPIALATEYVAKLRDFSFSDMQEMTIHYGINLHVSY